MKEGDGKNEMTYIDDFCPIIGIHGTAIMPTMQHLEHPPVRFEGPFLLDTIVLTHPLQKGHADSFRAGCDGLIRVFHINEFTKPTRERWVSTRDARGIIDRQRHRQRGGVLTFPIFP
jgi:hypothetical protein